MQQYFREVILTIDDPYPSHNQFSVRNDTTSHIAIGCIAPTVDKELLNNLKPAQIKISSET
jgi:CDP-diacylglycerol pyrophosphatase